MKSVASGITGFLLLYACFSPVVALAGQEVRKPSGTLRIVVIEGEDAVNVIQQKTAVAPVVEVRDQNGLPVPGAVVRFTIGGGNASFTGGSQTLTITTNAAGRAAAGAVNPLASGSVQIQVQATFQGQSAAATIAQTNVATAAQAAGAAAAGAGVAGAGAGAGGGGVSGLAIAGIAGGVGAGAAVVAVRKGYADEEGDADEQADSVIDPAVQAASGRYVLQQINGVGLPAVSVPSPPNGCPVVTDNATLTLTARLQVFELSESSRNDCRIGTNTSFQSTVAGSWSLQAGTVTLVLGGAGSGIDFGPGTLTGSTLTMLWGPPHVETGKQTARLNTVWVK
jgi:hypothetical protein